MPASGRHEASSTGAAGGESVPIVFVPRCSCTRSWATSVVSAALEAEVGAPLGVVALGTLVPVGSSGAGFSDFCGEAPALSAVAGAARPGASVLADWPGPCRSRYDVATAQ